MYVNVGAFKLSINRELVYIIVNSLSPNRTHLDSGSYTGREAGYNNVYVNSVYASWKIYNMRATSCHDYNLNNGTIICLLLWCQQTRYNIMLQYPNIFYLTYLKVLCLNVT